MNYNILKKVTSASSCFIKRSRSYFTPYFPKKSHRPWVYKSFEERLQGQLQFLYFNHALKFRISRYYTIFIKT